MDIGSNTVRLLVADVTAESPGLVVLERLSTFTALGRARSADGRFDPAAVAASLAALAAYREVASSLGVDRVVSVATSATRDASDREVFLERAGDALGVRPRVIDGVEEAGLSFAGASLSAVGLRPLLVIDLGGGSTEFVLGVDSADFRTSIDLGSARLTDRCFGGFPADKASLDRARMETAALLEPVSLPRSPGSVVAVGGTFVTLGSIIAGLPREERDALTGRLLRADAFHPLAERLAHLTIDEIGALPAVRPERAPVLVAGAVIASGIIRALGIETISISTTDLLEGLALRAVQGG